LALVAVLCACQPSFDPASYVTGLRLLAVRAEPPEVAPGESVTLTTLAVDPTGGVIDITWQACQLAPGPGDGTLNPDCLRPGPAPFLTPLGQGPTLMVAVPEPPTPQLPDETGGIYLPVRLDLATMTDQVSAIDRLRIAPGASSPRNSNPHLTAVQADGAPLLEDAPLPVHAGQNVTLRALFSDDSAEAYTISAAGQVRQVTEILNAAWFATGGSLSEGTTGGEKPDTTWKGDKNLPPAGGPIDLWVVGRDERGGVDFLHRQLVVR
jgi:hypothetical protein